MRLLDLLDDALRGGNAETRFDEVAHRAPKAELAHGVTEVLRSDQTPPFADIVGKLFGESSATQQAGLLNRIIGGLGPSALGGLGGGVLGRVLTPGSAQITPEQAAQLSPDEVREVAAQAERQQPGIVDQVGDFYAEHSGLIKMLGGAALAIVLAKMKDRAVGR